MAEDLREQLPDRQPINRIQAQRLSGLTGIAVTQLENKSVAQLSEEFRWRIDPKWLLFERICGRVVKTDPITGMDHPVPFATVHVQDTDCSFLGFYPMGWKWGWLYPIWCTRHDLATVVTDNCGRFCVWVPRWDIDWILEWRRERICYPIIFLRPSIRDLLGQLQYPRPIVHPPLPDPPPDLLTDGGMTLRRAEEVLGRQVAYRLAAQQTASTLGSPAAPQTELLDRRAHLASLPPPLPRALQEVQGGESRRLLEEHLAAMATRHEVEKLSVESLSIHQFLGPFWRCYDIWLPEWVPIFDAPDITFWVTQDADGDGDQETIYGESWFDVRWDAVNIPPVTLNASQIALTSVTCNTPDVSCDNAPQLQFVGLMPLVNPPAPAHPYHDAATGYARRPNRPHPGGTISEVPPPWVLAEAPYTWVLQLYGCNHVEGAQFYRMEYQFNSGSWVAFAGLTWPLHRVVGATLQTIWQSADGAGWYPIVPEAEGWNPPHLLLNWPTNNGAFLDGFYNVHVQVADGTKNVIAQSANVGFQIDNSYPVGAPQFFTGLHWRREGGAWSGPLELICPVIVRPKSGGKPVDIDLEVSYATSAKHLRSVQLTGGGCGGGNPTPISPQSTTEHWHTNPADNSVTNTAIFKLAGTMPAGAYSFTLSVASRAFNPAGGDGGEGPADWNYDPVYNAVYPMLPVAVVDEM